MGTPVRLDKMVFSEIEATPYTRWTHAEVFDDLGASALAELPKGPSRSVAGPLGKMFERLRGVPVEDDRDVAHLLGLDESMFTDLGDDAVALSALRTVVTLLQAAHSGLSLTEALGGKPTESVELYANINRALLTLDRSPPSFAAQAAEAVSKGFTTLKCAPFDEVAPPASPETVKWLAQPGIDRVAAVRSAVGPDVTVLVDCHRRFTPETAPWVAERLAELGVAWLEEPVHPTNDPYGMAAIAAQVSMPVAGGESGYGEPYFTDLLDRESTHVIMPDVLLCGGVSEAARAGKAAADRGKGFSLHSPSGPASLLASGHVSAVIAGAMALEHAVNEAPWRAELVDPPERVEGGRLWFPPGAGLGARLNVNVVQRRGRRWEV